MITTPHRMQKDAERATTIYSRSVLRELIETYGIHPQKRWGQNFLADRNSALKIVNALPQTEDSVVWEIGPGFGALTELIYERYRRVVLFEIDRALISYLRTRWPQVSFIASEQSVADVPPLLSPQARLTLVGGDACHTLSAALAHNAPPDIVLGNLPYSAAARLMLCCVRSPTPPRILIVTVQKEIADRVSAHAGKNYSSFSALMQLVYRLQHRWTVSRAVFHPTPHVESTCVQLIRNDAIAPSSTGCTPTSAITSPPSASGAAPPVTMCYSAAQVALVEPLLRASFQSRRAMLHKNLCISPRYRRAYQQLREWGGVIPADQHLPDGSAVADDASATVDGGASASAIGEPLEQLVRRRAEQLAPYQFVQLAELLRCAAAVSAPPPNR